MALSSVNFVVASQPGLVNVLFGEIAIQLDADTARQMGESLIKGADNATEKFMKEIENAG